MYRIYGQIHNLAKRLLKKSTNEQYCFVNIEKENLQGDMICSDLLKDCTQFNEIKNPSRLKKNEVFPIENVVPNVIANSFIHSFKKNSYSVIYSNTLDNAINSWRIFIDNSHIETGYKYAGLHFTGYIQEFSQWCLPSWIWTNAAIVRYYCSIGDKEKAIRLGKLLIEQQQECGGWIVRNEFNNYGVIPILAPNDSCYIALNSCLNLYDLTSDKAFLNSAERCAMWVINEAKMDGLVRFGYDCIHKKWLNDRNIVDIGFTAGLFAKLYEITNNQIYYNFLKRFVNSYISIFYMPKMHCFCTAIDGENKQYGGAFGRGQAWALEGIIPTYKVLKDNNIKRVIEQTIENLLNKQLSNGAWSYNLLKPLMGEDGKAVPIIAKSIVEWYSIGNKDERYIFTAKKALEWCGKHTAVNGSGEGGIFSYTIEGAIAHHRYTKTAFVYSSAYALELYDLIKNK